VSYTFVFAFLAVEGQAKAGFSARFRQNPGSFRHWRIVTNVLRVPAVKDRDPVTLLILAESADFLLHQPSS